LRLILAATDLSERATAALRRAGRLATEHSSAVILCHVVDDDQPVTMQNLEKEEALRLLEETKLGVTELTGVQSSTSVVMGDPFEGILRAGQEAGADLIVIGSHRRRLLRDIFVGTTAERIMRQGSLPVLMVNRPPASNYRRIVVSVDLSDISSQALCAAKQLGLFSGAQVIVFHAFDAMLTTLASASVSQERIQEHLADATMNARREVEDFLSGIDLSGVKYSISVQEGAPVLALKNAVKSLNADLVVLGTRGRSGGIVKFILGSVAEEAIRELEGDVLVVPPRME